MASDEHALVFDNGSHTIKAGFSCKDEPQVIIPSVTGRPKTKFLNHITFNPNLKERYVGNEAQTNSDILALSHPVENGVIKHWDDMQKLWQYTFDKLDASPKEQPILLTEIPNNPKANREKMAEVMFETFKCPAMYISIQGVLSLHSYGHVTGVAVDCGADVTQIVPIIEGYSIPNGTSCLPIGGHDITLYLLKLLAENGVIFSTKHCIEDICRVKEKLCYVAANFDKEMEMARKSQGLRQTYTLPDNHTITVGSEQFCCPEILFQPQILGRNFDGIHKMCCASIIKSNQPDEITRDLFRNIALSGGSSMYPGLPYRFSQEINTLAPSYVHPNVLAVDSRANNVWIGGSIVASLTAFQDMWLTKQEYQENGPLYIHNKLI